LAHHKSAIKRIRTSEKSQKRNRARQSVIRTLVRKLGKAEGEAAVKLGKELCSAVDHLARKGLLHKNKASHMKSAAQKKMAAAAKKKRDFRV
jgi:small subunit ribosomal protein S20